MTNISHLVCKLLSVHYFIRPFEQFFEEVSELLRFERGTCGFVSFGLRADAGTTGRLLYDLI